MIELQVGTFGTGDAGRIVGLPQVLVRACARDGALSAARDARGRYALAFGDLRLLQTVRRLMEGRVPFGSVRRALRALRKARGDGLASVALEADGRRVLAREGFVLWAPESGQMVMDCRAPDRGAYVPPLPMRHSEAAAATDTDGATAQDRFEEGCDLEAVDPAAAAESYRAAIEIDAGHPEAHINLGRLLHGQGRRDAAVSHYRQALRARPGDATAAFNLGVALGELGRLGEAADALEQALRSDPAAADAHYSLARVYERLGRKAAAVRSLKAYQRLTRGV